MSSTACPTACPTCSTAWPTALSPLPAATFPTSFRHRRRYPRVLAPASTLLAVVTRVTRGWDRGGSADEDLADRVDQQAGQRPHHRAVDADELEVAPDLELDLAGRLL